MQLEPKSPFQGGRGMKWSTETPSLVLRGGLGRGELSSSEGLGWVYTLAEENNSYAIYTSAKAVTDSPPWTTENASSELASVALRSRAG
jgi:hypothetical protein